jgi:hypothetical protein
MKFERVLRLFMIGLVVMSVSISAHHSTVAYAQKPIALKNATMTKIVWSHPHVILTFAVKDTKGSASTWSAESGSPGSVARLGWHRNSVKVGDVVTIELFPAKNGARVGRLKRVIFPDGRELLDTQSNPESLKQ